MSLWNRLFGKKNQPNPLDGKERRRELTEKAKVGLSTRMNDAVIREAIEKGDPIFITVRKVDGFVLCNESLRPTYSSKEFVERYPEGAARTVMYVEVDPRDPLKNVNLGDDGCWYYTPPKRE